VTRPGRPVALADRQRLSEPAGGECPASPGTGGADRQAQLGVLTDTSRSTTPVVRVDPARVLRWTCSSPAQALSWVPQCSAHRGNEDRTLGTPSEDVATCPRGTRGRLGFVVWGTTGWAASDLKGPMVAIQFGEVTRRAASAAGLVPRGGMRGPRSAGNGGVERSPRGSGSWRSPDRRATAESSSGNVRQRTYR